MLQTEYDGHKFGGAGVYFVDEKGSMFADYGSFKLFPEEKFKDFTPPPRRFPIRSSTTQEWIKACKEGTPTTCNFDYSRGRPKPSSWEPWPIASAGRSNGTPRAWSSPTPQKQLS